MQGGHSKVIACRTLLAAIVTRAVDDLEGIGPPCRRSEVDKAMAFILSESCEMYCLELGIDYQAVKEKASALYRRFLEGDFPGP